jgi:hypothetical protein
VQRLFSTIYIDQAGRSFKTGSNEYIRTIKYHKYISTYSQHIINTGYTHGNMQDKMEIIRTTRKVTYEYHREMSHHLYKKIIHVNELPFDLNNPVFIILQNNKNTSISTIQIE